MKIAARRPAQTETDDRDPQGQVPEDGAWEITWRDRVTTIPAIVVLLLLICWCGVRQIPRGICLGDSGDLQLSSAILGIAHPPGYAGYTTVGYLLTRIAGSNPAYTISVACFATGLIVLVVCLLFQRHLGVSSAFAITTTLVLAAHPRFWTNLRSPEVYMPTLALVTASGLFLVRHGHSHSRPHLFLAVLLFGAALGNRPPVLLLAPFLLIAWFQIRRRSGRREAWRDLIWMVPVAVAPMAYSVAYVYVRDEPDLCYNYIDNFNEETRTLPHSTEGARARLQRAVWHVSAQQFRQYMGTDWRGAVAKLRWVETQVAHGTPLTDVLVSVFLALGMEPPAARWYPQIDVYVPAFLALIGLAIVFKRCRVSGIVLTGLAFSCLAFVVSYKVYGQAADLLPLLFAETVALGVLGSSVFSSTGTWMRHTAGLALAIVASGLFLVHMPHRAPDSTGVPADAYLDELDLETFPGPAVICAEWPESIPIRYAQCVTTSRRDLHVVTATPEHWPRIYRESAGPVYVTDETDLEPPCRGARFRNIFRMECANAARQKPSTP